MLAFGILLPTNRNRRPDHQWTLSAWSTFVRQKPIGLWTLPLLTNLPWGGSSGCIREVPPDIAFAPSCSFIDFDPPPLLFHGLREGIKGELGPGDPPQELEEVISWPSRWRIACWTKHTGVHPRRSWMQATS